MINDQPNPEKILEISKKKISTIRKLIKFCILHFRLSLIGGDAFHFFGLIFEVRATFKGVKHVTHKSAQATVGIKLFVDPRPSILAIIDIYGSKR